MKELQINSREEFDQMPQQEILRRLKSAFPEAITEQQHDTEDGRLYYTYAVKLEFIEQLRNAGLDIANDQNRYELQFPGKRLAKAAVSVPCHKTLRADKEQSKNFDETENVFIEGDNLDALRMLQKSYRGKIKVIYIDPPYNTGGDDFVYNDDFSVMEKDYLRQAGVVDEDGEKQIDEIQNGLKGRFHAGWLAFMYPRLKLARELLSEDGVIFISIDDNEQANLKLVCDEIFGDGNLMGCVMWNSTKSVTNTALISVGHTYNLIYAKDKDYYVKNRHCFRLPEEGVGFKNSDNDPRGPWKADPFQVGGRRPNQQYEIKNPTTGEIYKPNPGSSWKNDYNKFKELLADNRIVFGLAGKTGPQRKRFLSEAKNRGRVATTWWDDVGTTTDGTRCLNNLFSSENVFSNPKPIDLLKEIIQLADHTNSGTILDFFAGSATTAHAVMQLNAEDGGKRKFILVQLPEQIDANKSKEAYNFCTEKLKRPATIAEIAKERIRRAGKLIADGQTKKQSAENLDAGFRAFVIEDSPFGEPKEQPLAKTRQGELEELYMVKLTKDKFELLLYQTMLETGVTLDQPLFIGEIKTYPFAICARHCYCVTEGLTQEAVQAIDDKHGDEFDVFYYLNDALDRTTSSTDIEAALNLFASDKQIKGLAFY